MAAQRSLLGPLNSTFTPAPSCTVNVNAEWQGQSCFGGRPRDAPGCWPTATVGAPGPPLSGWGFYSPGLVCPKGYSIACTGGPAGFSFQFGLFPSETAAGCCPTGYACTQGFAQTCVLTTTAVSVTGASCTGSTLGSLFTVIPTSAASATAGATSTAAPAITRIGYVTVDQAGLYAPLFQLVWQASDTATSTTSSSTTSSTTTSSTTTSSTTTSSPTHTPTQSPTPSPGLSTGAIVAISVVVTVVVIAAAAVFACIFLRRRRRRRLIPYTPAPGFADPRGEQGTEMPGFERKAELPAETARHELDANTPQRLPEQRPGPLVEIG